MKTKLTDGLPSVIITDVKRNHSMYNEYCDSNDPISGSMGKDGIEDISLDNIHLSENNPDLLKQRQEDEIQRLADKDSEELRLAEEEKKKLENEETPEAKLEREKLEAEQNKIILDTEGNQIDKDGKILKTKEVLAEEAQALIDAENIPLINELITVAGVEILDENGTPKVYEDSTEGVIQYVNDLAEYKLKQSQKELFKAFPKVEKYLQAQINGIPDEQFFGQRLNDWKEVKVDETNEAQQITIITQDLLSKGIDKDRVIKMVNRIKDSGKDILLEESNASLESLKTNQIKDEKEKIEKNKEYISNQEEIANKHWTEVNKIITSGKISNYIIPEIDRKAFNDFVSLAADDDGNSAAMIARSKQTLEQKLLLDFYIFKKMDFTSLAKTTLQQQNLKSLKDRINKNNNNGTSLKIDDKSSVNIGDIKLENIVRT